MCSRSTHAGECEIERIAPPPNKVLQLTTNPVRGLSAAEAGRQAP